MPLPNEHTARQLPPSDFQSFKTSRKDLPEGIRFIVGVREDETVAIQSVRFEKDIWSEESAFEWLRDNGFAVDKFEGAGGAGGGGGSSYDDDDEDDEVDDDAEPVEAGPDELVVGDFVKFMGDDDAEHFGRIDSIETDGDVSGVEATPDDPVAVIEVFEEHDEGWVSTGNMSIMHFSKLELIDPLSVVEPEPEEEPADEDPEMEPAEEAGATLDFASMSPQDAYQLGLEHGRTEPIDEKVLPFADLPLAEVDTPWSFTTVAENELLGDPPDWDRYAKVHAWVDPEMKETKAGYKLPFGMLVDGEIRAVWRGVAAAMAALNGARGGVDIPESEREGVYSLLSKYYEKFDKEIPPLA